MDNSSTKKVRIPKGINIIGQEDNFCPEVEKRIFTNIDLQRQSSDTQQTWSYIYVHHCKVERFVDIISETDIPYFVHRTTTYRHRKASKGIETLERPTISGLVFLQGNPNSLHRYLNSRFTDLYLVKDCSTHQPAVISDSRMRPFMRLLETDPERIRFLVHRLEYYAQNNVRVRILTGTLAGFEGYIVRIDRDRRLVMNIGDITVAIANIHRETFEEVME